MRYDIAVIGNDEAAFEMLCLAAASQKKTLAVLPESRHSAWLVAQALRRLVSGLLVDRTAKRRQFFRRSGSPKLLQTLIARAVTAEVREHEEMLRNIGADVMVGEARFIDRNSLTVSQGFSCSRERVCVDNIVIGTGLRRTAMHRPIGLVPFHQPESLLTGLTLPESVYIVGGGEFGAGLAALVSLFGVSAHLIARPDDSSAMLELASASGVRIGHHPADVGLESFGARFSELHSDVVDCRRKVGFTNHLSLDAIDIEVDEHGQLWCASSFETWCSGVFGIGDVVGFSPDTALHPSVQAERVMDRIAHSIRRPHLMKAFANTAVSA